MLHSAWRNSRGVVGVGQWVGFIAPFRFERLEKRRFSTLNFPILGRAGYLDTRTDPRSCIVRLLRFFSTRACPNSHRKELLAKTETYKRFRCRRNAEDECTSSHLYLYPDPKVAEVIEYVGWLYKLERNGKPKASRYNSPKLQQSVTKIP